MILLQEMSMFNWGLLECEVLQSVQFCIGGFSVYIFLILTHPVII